jgi:hypothetical protein
MRRREMRNGWTPFRRVASRCSSGNENGNNREKVPLEHKFALS